MAISAYASRVLIPESVKKNSVSVIDFLDNKFSRIGRNTWISRIERGNVLDENEKPVSASDFCIPGKRLLYFREVEKEPQIPFKEIILFQNDHLVVACKPHFLPVIPSGPYVNECLLNRLKKKLDNPFLTPVNRIDRETAGIVLFSSEKQTRGAYQQLFMSEQVTKTYQAITKRTEDSPMGKTVIENRMEKGTPWFRMKIVNGEINARTTAEMIDSAKDRALFQLSAHTGKKHQLRVHLSSIGCPIINDNYYPDLLPEKEPDFNNPLQLLARKLEFIDPVSGKKRMFLSHHKLSWDKPEP